MWVLSDWSWRCARLEATSHLRHDSWGPVSITSWTDVSAYHMSLVLWQKALSALTLSNSTRIHTKIPLAHTHTPSSVRVQKLCINRFNILWQHSISPTYRHNGVAAKLHEWRSSSASPDRWSCSVMLYSDTTAPLRASYSPVELFTPDACMLVNVATKPELTSKNQHGRSLHSKLVFSAGIFYLLSHLTKPNMFETCNNDL